MPPGVTYLTLGSPFRSPLFLATAVVLVAAASLLDGGAGGALVGFAATVGVISAGKAAERWSRRSASASPDYEDGVRSTPRSWAAASSAAEASYKAGVTAAAGAGMYGKGIQKAGDARWKKRTAEVGPMRYAQGVGAAQQDYATAVGPVLDLIGRVDLTPRGPVGSPGNYQRAVMMATALRGLRAK